MASQRRAQAAVEADERVDVDLDGELGRAAELLHISQSPLSRQIKQLEEWLGHDLFRKRGRGLELTSEGRVALGYAALSYQSLMTGLNKLEINKAALASHLAVGWKQV